MGEKALKLAKEDILKTIQNIRPEISTEEMESLSEEILKEIDWDNPALMHKGIAWIVDFYLRNQTKSS